MKERFIYIIKLTLNIIVILINYQRTFGNTPIYKIVKEEIKRIYCILSCKSIYAGEMVYEMNRPIPILHTDVKIMTNRWLVEKCCPYILTDYKKETISGIKFCML